MQHEETDLVARVAALELQNRRLRRMGTALLAGGLFLGLSAFVAPLVCDTITAERLVIRDSQGKQRLVLDAYATPDPTVTFKDRKGKDSARLALGAAGSLDISIFSEGQARTAQFLVQDGRVVAQEAGAQARQVRQGEVGID